MTTHCSGPRHTVSIRCPEDLLALIPHQLGYEPRDCAVLFIPVPGGGALCLKLRTPIHDGEPDAFARELSGVLAGVEHCGRAAVVVYSGSALPDEAENDFLNAAWLGAAVERCGLRALSGLVVGPRHWWDLEAPAEPRPVSAIADSALNAHMIALGSSVQPHAPGEPPPLPAGRERRAADFLAAVAAASGAAGSEEHDTPEELLRWDRALTAVAAGTREGAGSVLALPDHELARLVVSLRCGVTRDALLYAWLTGDRERAARAALGLRAAVARLRGPIVPGPGSGPRRAGTGAGEPAEHGVGGDHEEAGGNRGGTDHAEEGLRCVRTVMGQWEGRPHWESVEAAYRVLEVLDSLFSHPGTASLPDGMAASTAGPEPGLPAGLARGHADVVSVRAQLELYRGRAFTANALLERCDAISPHRPSAAAVMRRLQLQDVPWWCKDPRTAWPGRGWWDTPERRVAQPRAGERWAGKKYL